MSQTYTLDRYRAYLPGFSVKGRRDVLQPICESRNWNINAVGNVAYIRKYNFFYNRIKKNANSNTMVILNYVLRGQSESVLRSRKNIVHLHHMFDWEMERVAGCRSLLIKRNPYSRVLSAFLDKFRKEHIIKKYGRFDLTPEGFRQFVGWLADGGLDRNAHWDLQCRQMLLPADSHSHVVEFDDYVGQLRAAMLDLGVPERRLDILETKTVGTSHATQAREKLDRYYDSATRDMVYELYKSDFRMLGYER